MKDGSFRTSKLESNGVIPGVKGVVWKLSPTFHPVAVSRWFTTPNADLTLDDEAVSPIAWLASGGPPAGVAALAGSIDEL